MVTYKVGNVYGAALFILGCWASVTHADLTSESFTFNVSNTFSNVTDYGSVDISANDSTGIVEFVVDAAENPDDLYGTLDNFGIQKFGFNFTDNSIASSIASMALPTGWSFTVLPSNSLNMFGVFELTTDGTGNTRQDPLEFALTLSDATFAIASNFVAPSSEGYLFAAHVAGFDTAGSHWIAVTENGEVPGSNPIPAPGALALGLIGLVSLGFSNRRLQN